MNSKLRLLTNLIFKKLIDYKNREIHLEKEDFNKFISSLSEEIK